MQFHPFLIEDLKYVCPTCGEWFIGDEPKVRTILYLKKTVVDETYRCPNDNTLLTDADVAGVCTPYEQLQVNLMTEHYGRLKSNLTALEKDIKDIIEVPWPDIVKENPLTYFEILETYRLFDPDFKPDFIPNDV